MPNRFRKSLEQAEGGVEDSAAVDAGAGPVDVQPPRGQGKNNRVENQQINADVYDIFTDNSPKKRGRDLTVYLTNEVWEAVDNLSKGRDIGKSRIVDKALREVLKIG